MPQKIKANFVDITNRENIYPAKVTIANGRIQAIEKGRC